MRKSSIKFICKCKQFLVKRTTSTRRQKHLSLRILSNPSLRLESLDENWQTPRRLSRIKIQSKFPLDQQRKFPKLQTKLRSYPSTLALWLLQLLLSIFVVKISEVFTVKNSKMQLMKKWHFDEREWEEKYLTMTCSDLKTLKKLLNMLKSFSMRWKRLKLITELSETMSTILSLCKFQQEIELRLLTSLKSFMQFLIWFQRLFSYQFRRLTGL